MRTILSCPLFRALSAFTFLLAVSSSTEAASDKLTGADAKVPEGFTKIFDGKDLTGWHGMPHYDPYKLAAMAPDKRKAQIAEWTTDAKKHWTVDKGELVNDGKGAYLTTDKEFGDIE